MAYCRFDFDAAPGPAGARAGAFTRPTGVHAGLFARNEWQVIALARLAGPASLEKPGRVGRVAERLFGKPPHRPLDDGRLESLRRLAVRAWKGGWEQEADQFLASGYGATHLEALLTMVAAAR